MASFATASLAGWLASCRKTQASASPALNLSLHSDVRPGDISHSPATRLRFGPCVKTRQGQVPNGVARRRPLAASGPVSKDQLTRHLGPVSCQGFLVSALLSGKAITTLGEITAES